MRGFFLKLFKGIFSLIVGSLVLCLAVSWAGGASKVNLTKGQDKALERIKGTIGKLRETKGLKASIAKKVSYAFKSTPSRSQGELQYSRGNVRLSFGPPQQTLIVLNQDKLWMETRVAGFEEEEIQVSRMNAKQLRKSNIILSILFGEKEILNGFKVESVQNKKNKALKVRFLPLDSKESQYQRLEISLTPEDKLSAIRIWDSLKNETGYKFKNLSLDQPIDKKAFTYVPPKGATITDF